MLAALVGLDPESTVSTGGSGAPVRRAARADRADATLFPRPGRIRPRPGALNWTAAMNPRRSSQIVGFRRLHAPVSRGGDGDSSGVAGTRLAQARAPPRRPAPPPLQAAAAQARPVRQRHRLGRPGRTRSACPSRLTAGGVGLDLPPRTHSGPASQGRACCAEGLKDQPATAGTSTWVRSAGSARAIKLFVDRGEGNGAASRAKSRGQLSYKGDPRGGGAGCARSSPGGYRGDKVVGLWQALHHPRHLSLWLHMSRGADSGGELRRPLAWQTFLGDSIKETADAGPSPNRIPAPAKLRGAAKDSVDALLGAI